MNSSFIQAIESKAAEVNRAIASGPILPCVTATEIRQHLAQHYSFDTPLPIEEVAGDVESMMSNWQVQITHPRYFGLYNPSVTFAYVLGDTLAAIYNPQLATWRTAPGPIEMERHILAWLASRFGMPSCTSASFTSGGNEANLCATTAALLWKFPDLGEAGLRNLPGQPTVYRTDEAHHSYDKIATISGLGRQALRTVKTLPNHKMDVSDLAFLVARDRADGCIPLMVVGTAGTTAGGIIDPLPEIAAFCKREGIWFHADAAYGGAAILSAKLKPALAGIELADSITCDAHKWFSVPMGAGMFFCRHPEAVAEAFRVETPYMPARTMATGQDTPDPYAVTPQWSRRFMGLKFFMSLAHHGEEGYARMFDHQVRMCGLLRELLEHDGWQIVNETPLPVICFRRDGVDVAEFVEGLHRNQIAWMAATRLGGGEPVVRACITSFRTTEEDIREVAAAIRAQLRQEVCV
jgi:glutamate/tyrosine decarboxylase-like PLP-dependent enzyme